ncbi:MAG TPA: hypothetical protein DER01_08860 [Phycisphaerales bacterium]|nr:hypothetical protein [Phycisphaerales bacterium]|tara:strand:+ start:30632 stop:32650 length:2019 start_codon:yes stop_codon:yes gene_type:complete
MKYHLPLTVVLAGSTLLGMPVLHAQDTNANSQQAATQQATELEQTVVKATPPKKPDELIVDSDEIAKVQASSIADLLSNELSITIGGGDTPVAQKIYIRGLEDTMFNITIDGAPQSGELYHHQGRIQIEPEFIKSIELEAGSGAATNGMGALGGAVHFTTKDAFDMLSSGQDVGALFKAMYRFNGDNAYKGVASVYGKLSENIGVLGAFTYDDGEDYDDGHGNVVDPTNYNHQNGYVKFNGDFGDHYITLTYERMDNEGVYYSRPHMIGFTHPTQVLTDHQIERETLTYQHVYDPASDLVDAKLTLFYTDNHYDNVRHDTGGPYSFGSMISFGFDLRNSSIIDTHGITYGVEYRHDNASGGIYVGPPPVLSAGGQSAAEADFIGLYVQDNWDLTDDLLLSFGMRVDYFNYDPETGQSESDTGFSPNVKLAYEVVEGLMLSASYAEAYRGVIIKETALMGLYPNTNGLDPEESSNIEFGIKYEKDWFFAKGSLYRQDIYNYIDTYYANSGADHYLVNAGDVKIDGYEVEVGGQWDNLRLSLGMWNSNSRFNGEDLDDQNLGLGTTVGRTWIGKLDYSLPQYNLDYFMVGRFVEELENTASTTAPPKESYFVLDLGLSWQPKGNDSLTLAFNVNNVFDEFYYDHSSFSYNPNTSSYVGFADRGREFVLSATVKF